MKYKSFRIRNFKGIKDTTIELHGLAGANVFALVGLNESGKTTVLEAIHSFAPDHATSELLGGKARIPFKDRVPEAPPFGIHRRRFCHRDAASELGR